MRVFRPEFTAALEIFAAISQMMDAEGFQPPILVGGAAVELYSGSTVMTGDFDVVTVRQDRFEAALLEHGFEKPRGPGMLMRGWVHPELKFGFEVVGSMLLDGHADRDRVRILEVAGGDYFAVISLEDLIADRMSQYASGTAAEMLGQAKTLFALSGDIDIAYMDQRIREETGDQYGVSDLQD